MQFVNKRTSRIYSVINIDVWFDECVKKLRQLVLCSPNINVDYTVDSTGAFVDKLQEFQLQNGDYSVSFDVTSLYTNVPLEETIHLIAEKVYSFGSKKVPPFKKKEFIKLMKFTTGGMFLYNGRLFKQVDSVAMGSQLGPSLANFFLGYLKETRFFDKVSNQYCTWDILMTFLLFSTGI